MNAFRRAVKGLLVRGCTAQQVLCCSLPAELVNTKDRQEQKAIGLFVLLIAPHIGRPELRRAVEEAVEEIRREKKCTKAS